ncbi:putative ATP-binding ABC transporter [Anopheles sinensis]|uniref:Putative ATP-binding ABC transporter n=1 Tax=Anopheles sinensis TaxID=74873 RepID=A0A084WC53_ANOSI|nr:putative ATP-binding ABC transporter [Anopheles sinensis]
MINPRPPEQQPPVTSARVSARSRVRSPAEQREGRSNSEDVDEAYAFGLFGKEEAQTNTLALAAIDIDRIVPPVLGDTLLSSRCFRTFADCAGCSGAEGADTMPHHLRAPSNLMTRQSTLLRATLDGAWKWGFPFQGYNTTKAKHREGAECRTRIPTRAGERARDEKKGE